MLIIVPLHIVEQNITIDEEQSVFVIYKYNTV